MGPRVYFPGCQSACALESGILSRLCLVCCQHRGGDIFSTYSGQGAVSEPGGRGKESGPWWQELRSGEAGSSECRNMGKGGPSVWPCRGCLQLMKLDKRQEARKCLRVWGAQELGMGWETHA